MSERPPLRVFHLRFNGPTLHDLRELGDMAAIFLAREIAGELWIAFGDGNFALYENTGGNMGYTIIPGDVFDRVRIENRIGGVFEGDVVLSPCSNFLFEGAG